MALLQKVYQIAVDKDHRKQGVGTMLFNAIRERNNGDVISLNNVEDTAEATRLFLTQVIGLKNPVSQFEMKRSI
jgi:GNAT superfamily N-acetyltransferase